MISYGHDGPDPTLATLRVAALYRFARIDDLDTTRQGLFDLCQAQGVQGTLLIAHEGLNGTIAGTDAAIAVVVAHIRAMAGFAELDVKYAHAPSMPFHRLKVRIKSEIVTMGHPEVDPVRDAGTYVQAADWNSLIADPATVVIDTRNDYEVAVGTFAGAIQPHTRTFRDFPGWFEAEGRALFDGPRPPRVAMFCTGGIRCEKATAYLKAEGIADVHHLEGGVLRYLETVPAHDSLWQGECFVFDERVAVGHGLEAGTHTLCRGCRLPLNAEGRASPHYVEGVCCDRCHDNRDADRRRASAERHRQVGLAADRGQVHIGAKPVVPR